MRIALGGENRAVIEQAVVHGWELDEVVRSHTHEGAISGGRILLLQDGRYALGNTYPTEPPANLGSGIYVSTKILHELRESVVVDHAAVHDWLLSRLPQEGGSLPAEL